MTDFPSGQKRASSAPAISGNERGATVPSATRRIERVPKPVFSSRPEWKTTLAPSGERAGDRASIAPVSACAPLPSGRDSHTAPSLMKTISSARAHPAESNTAHNSTTRILRIPIVPSFRDQSPTKRQAASEEDRLKDLNTPGSASVLRNGVHNTLKRDTPAREKKNRYSLSKVPPRSSFPSRTTVSPRDTTVRMSSESRPSMRISASAPAFSSPLP